MSFLYGLYIAAGFVILAAGLTKLYEVVYDSHASTVNAVTIAMAAISAVVGWRLGRYPPGRARQLGTPEPKLTAGATAVEREAFALRHREWEEARQTLSSEREESLADFFAFRPVAEQRVESIVGIAPSASGMLAKVKRSRYSNSSAQLRGPTTGPGLAVTAKGWPPPLTLEVLESEWGPTDQWGLGGSRAVVVWVEADGMLFKVHKDPVQIKHQRSYREVQTRTVDTFVYRNCPDKACDSWVAVPVGGHNDLVKAVAEGGICSKCLSVR